MKAFSPEGVEQQSPAPERSDAEALKTRAFEAIDRFYESNRWAEVHALHNIESVDVLLGSCDESQRTRLKTGLTWLINKASSVRTVSSSDNSVVAQCYYPFNILYYDRTVDKRQVMLHGSLMLSLEMNRTGIGSLTVRLTPTRDEGTIVEDFESQEGSRDAAGTLDTMLDQYGTQEDHLSHLLSESNKVEQWLSTYSDDTNLSALEQKLQKELNAMALKIPVHPKTLADQVQMGRQEFGRWSEYQSMRSRVSELQTLITQYGAETLGQLNAQMHEVIKRLDKEKNDLHKSITEYAYNYRFGMSKTEVLNEMELRHMERRGGRIEITPRYTAYVNANGLIIPLGTGETYTSGTYSNGYGKEKPAREPRYSSFLDRDRSVDEDELMGKSISAALRQKYTSLRIRNVGVSGSYHEKFQSTSLSIDRSSLLESAVESGVPVERVITDCAKIIGDVIQKEMVKIGEEQMAQDEKRRETLRSWNT